VFRWLKSKVQAAIAASHRREMEGWVRKLRRLDADEVAYILAIAMHYRNSAMQRVGVDLMSPFDAIAQRPALALQLNHDLQLLQKKQMPTLASGAIIWLFTVRAARDPGLRDVGRELWAQLARGFHDVESAAARVGAAIGAPPLLTDAGRFPDGFTPVAL
jgi:hypothetical protein